MERLGSQWKDFHDIRHLRIFRKPVYKLQFRLKPNNISGTSQKYLCVFMTISRWILLRMRNVSDKICIKNENTPIFCPITFFFSRKSCSLWDNVEKYCRARQATDDNTAHAHCMLDNKGYKHTLRLCNTCCFFHDSSALIFTWSSIVTALTVTSRGGGKIAFGIGYGRSEIGLGWRRSHCSTVIGLCLQTVVLNTGIVHIMGRVTDWDSKPLGHQQH